MDLIQAKIAIKEKIDLESFLEENGISLKQEGKNLKGLCPFHTEKSPSFFVRPEFQTYHCFGCGESGDIFSFLQEKQGLSFFQAVSLLADRIGITLENNNQNDSIDYTKSYKILEDIDRYYKESYKGLPEYHVSKKDIESRGLDPNEDDLYGWAPENNGGLKQFLLKKGYTEKELLDINIFTEEYPDYDLMSGRLVFTIKNFMGKVIGFSGRTYRDSGGKYVNSRDSDIFKKSKSLYNIENAKSSIRKNKKVYIVEGLFDVIAMKKRGYANTVATCGTALTEDHLKQLMQYTNNGDIVLVLDGDEPGQKAALRAFNSFREIQENGKISVLSDDMDPCDYLKNNKSLPEEIFIIDHLINISKQYIKESKEPLHKKVEYLNDLFLDRIGSDIMYRDSIKKVSIILGITEWPQSPNRRFAHSNNTATKRVATEDVSNLKNEKYWAATALSFWLQNKSMLPKESLKKEDFSSMFWPLIDELILHYNDNPFLVENISSKYRKSVEKLINNKTINYSIDNEKEAISHFYMLIRQYKKQVKNKQLINLKRQIILEEGGDTET